MSVVFAVLTILVRSLGERSTGCIMSLFIANYHIGLRGRKLSRAAAANTRVSEQF